MQSTLRMRVTQILERSKLNTAPITVTFKTKNIWYAFMYWLLQAIILAIIYNGTMWFLPLFNLVTVGWAWDKITSGNLSESVFKPDIETGLSESSVLSETSHVLAQPSVFIQPVKATENVIFEPVIENKNENENSENENEEDRGRPIFSDTIIPLDMNDTIDNIKRIL
jgi:hypothetical protein